MSPVKQKVCLVVIDGWGKNNDAYGNAILNGKTPVMDQLESENNVYLQASEEHVGVPLNQMGNSEVGHLNIGAGRVVFQDIVRINKSIREDTLVKNASLIDAVANCNKNSAGVIHLLGLVSDGGVHSHIDHCLGLINAIKRIGAKKCYLHFFSDGRDTSPLSGVTFMEQIISSNLFKEGTAELATVVGRYYAMDRDKRWERIKIAKDAMVKKDSTNTTLVELKNLINYVKNERYAKNETDEFLKPIVIKECCEASRITDNSTLLFFDFRSDRMRQITSAFSNLVDIDAELKITDPNLTTPKLNLHITCMTQYNPSFTFPLLFPPVSMKNVLAEWLAANNCKQLHVAETEKYAHVTFFFNGGLEVQFTDEERKLVPSPKVATYDLKPEMSSEGVADEMVKAIESEKHDFVMCNFAPPDMVGHTGEYEPAIKACEATDIGIGRVKAACEKHNYVLCVTADHGNAEKMYNEEGGKHTAHTLFPVPFCVDKRVELVPFDVEKLSVDHIPALNGRLPALQDVATTVLDIMGLPLPAEMTGVSLLKK